MILLYLDESGDPGWPKPFGKSPFTWFVLAGMSLEDNQWKDVNEEYIKIIKKHFGSSFGNFDMKYSALTAGVPPYDKLSGIQRLNLADDIFNLILDTEPVLFAIVINKLAHKRYYGRKAHWPKQLALRFIAPRFHKYLERIKEYGIFVMDEEERKSDKHLKEMIQRARERGIILQSFLDPFRTNTRLPWLIESILFVPSEDSPRIPLADFCSHSVWLKYERGYHKRFDQIKHLFDNDSGNVYGLKEWVP